MTAPIVLDTSYALAMVMGDETSPSNAAEVLAADLVAPAIWTLEIANTLLVSQRRGRINAAQLQELLAVLAALKVQVQPALDLTIDHWCQFSGVHGLTTYDAQYLDLAMQKRCGIATCDARLAQAAARVGLPVYA
jgi:predicted nucleic acid-binding protein